MATVNLSTVVKRNLIGSATPTVGTYVVGDTIWDAAPAAGGSIGRVCTVAGTPGTWATFGFIQPVATVMTFNTQAGGTYTLVLADANDNVLVATNVSTANTVTVPPNASVAFAVGSQIEIMQLGAGQTTLVGGSGVIVNGTFTLKLLVQGARCTLLKTATNTWWVSGEMALS